MGLAAWVELITAILSFPKQMLGLWQALKGTPEEHREALVDFCQREAENYAKSGRPSWG